MKSQIFLIGFLVLLSATTAAPTAERSARKEPDASAVKPTGQQERNRRQNWRGKQRNIVEPTPSERRFLNITLADVERRTIKSTVEANGIFAAIPSHVAKIGPVISGRASEVLVDLGDWVEAGQPMAKLVSVQIGDAVSAFYKAVAELELAKIEFERYEMLISQDIGARKDLLTAEANYKIAQAGLNACEKALHALGFTEQNVDEIKNTHIVNAELLLRAPIAGRVVDRNVTVGERIGEDSTLFVIMDLRRLYVDAEIYERDISRVRRDQPTEIAAISLPEKIVSGKVILVEDIVDPETRTIKVRTEIDNVDGSFKVGMFAHVKIFTGSGGSVLCTPSEAVLEENGFCFVFVPHNGDFKLVPVVTGSRDGAYVEIVEGLSEGEKVVVGGNYGLYTILRQSTQAGGTSR
jgi:cobalt-zinc-cadmium efflux system membrane fusion protein